jgi:DNA ligase D-like protein (predicted ligase)
MTAKILSSLSEEHRERLREAEMPGWIPPMLATLMDDYFDDPDWIYERKLDGERVVGYKRRATVRLMSRNEQQLNDTYPELVDALLRQSAGRMIVDGEVVAFSGGVTSFERLQNRIQVKDREAARQSRVAVYYYVFDLLYLEGWDLTGLPLFERKRLLRSALDWDDPIRYTAYRRENGIAYHDEACEKGWEGVIAKDGTAEYIRSRSTQWLKFKCVNRQEFVIAGFTDPQGERIGFGAILIGYYEDDELHYAGRVGTGFDEDTLKRMRRRFDAIETEDCPFVEEDRAKASGVHWIAPRLVGEVGFTEWTADGMLRHPRFLGIRQDKEPGDVVRERPKGR